MNAPSPEAGARPFVPVLLLGLAVLVWTGFQTWQLLAERASLKELVTSQATQVDQSTKLRAALDRIASKTARLAAGGNGDASLIVEALKKRGVTINPDGSDPAPR